MRSRRWWLVVVLLYIACFSSGCWLTEDTRLKSWREWIKVPVEEGKKASSTAVKSNRTANIKELTKERITVELYFARKDGKGLEAEKRDIPKEEGIARKTIEALLAGPQNPNLNCPLPEGTKLLDINIKPDGLCIVNFSREITTVTPGKPEQLAVDAVVKTLCQFPSVKEVRFMVEGDYVDTLAGGVDISRPLKA